LKALFTPHSFKFHFRHLLLAHLLLLFFQASAGGADSLLLNSKNSLQLKGNIKFLKDPDKDNKGSVDSATVSVFNEDTVKVATFYTDKKGKTIFKLPLNRRFTVHISKKGFVTKIIEVNTKVPVSKMKDYEFEFDVGIFEEVKGLNVSVLQRPIAKVNFNNFMSIFDYDYNYTGKINMEIEQMYQDYYDLQQSMKEEEDYKKKKKGK
jgi:hypothetical protein